MGNKKGFLTFVLSATLLLAFVSAAAAFSHARASENESSLAFQRLVALHTQELAIKNAAYAGFADAAAKADATAIAANAAGVETDRRTAARAALYARALELGGQFTKSSFDVSFWCGGASEQSLSDASERMAQNNRAEVPFGAMPIGSPACANSLDVNVDSHTLHFSSIGFSYHSHWLQMSYSALLPSDYEVGY